MNERDIFMLALERDNPEARRAYLAEACNGDEGLRHGVEALLAVHERAGSFLAGPALGVSVPSDAAPIREGPGTVIGPYKLLEQIGEGGFGVVYMAEQQSPVRRKVALKILKLGLETRQVVARFEAERQALALMEHPNIARVFDGGETASGRPYFVMELVRGIPITNFCDDNHLSVRQRLELFVSVCQAVQHAHQKGIIHRDLKPSNIMVTSHDGTPVVKVIDFGIAKALGQQLTDKTLFTNFAQMIGTPTYMSPEQAQLSGLDMDTRTDIYSLGVLLYELLTSTTPCDTERLRTAAYDEIRRIIREEEPARPSLRVHTLGQASTPMSANRKSDPVRLSRLFRGELDWIVMKALEKDRNRRYETASAFGADVQRYLNDEQVQACPPSAGYRLRKFLRRHKGPVTAGLALAVLLVLGIVGTSTGMVWALRAEKLATDRLLEVTKEKERATSAEKQAEEEASIAKAVNDFLQNDLLAEAAPEKNARDKKVTVEELLRRASARIAGKFAQQPRIEAAIRMTIGNTYHSLSNLPAAQPHLERALELLGPVLGEDHPDTLSSMNSLAALYDAQGQYSKAEALFVKVLDLRRRVLGENHPDTLDSMGRLAVLFQHQGKYTQAESEGVATLNLCRRVLGEEHPGTLDAMNNLAGLYRIQGQYPKAEPLFARTLEVHRRLQGEEHPATLFAMSNLAWLYSAQGRYAEAEPLNIRVLEVRRRVLGEEHRDTLVATNNLAALYQAREEYAKAEPLYLKSLEGHRRHFGAEHPQTLTIMSNLAVLYRDQGRYAEAEPLYVETLAVRRRLLGAEHMETLISMNNLAGLHQDNGRDAEAERLHLQTLELKRRVLGDEHPSTLNTMNSLASLYRDQGQYLQAEALFVKTLEVRRRVLGQDHNQTLITLNDLAALYLARGQFATGERLSREALEQARKRQGGTSQLADALTSLGENLLKQGRHADAEPLLRECLKIREEKHSDNWKTFHARSLLGGSLLGQKKYAEAEPLLLAGCEGIQQREAKIPVPSRYRLKDAQERLVQLYDAWDKPEKAAEWRAKQK